VGPAGQLVKKIADLPSSEGVPINGVQTGPRSYRWHPLEPATLVWAEALDGGDLRNAVPFRDRIVTLKAPFDGEAAEVIKTEHRFQGLSWTEKGIALLSEFDRLSKVRMVRTWLLEPGAAPRKLWERSAEDRYTNPGSPVSKPVGAASAIVQLGDTIYLTGEGASKEGDRPFLDRLDLKTLATQRIFQTDQESYETVVALLSPDAKTFITRYESRIEPPNYFVRTAGAGSRQALTSFPDPAPQLTGIDRQLLTYKRDDGVQLSATLYLPPGYKAGERLPVVVWAYPREFTDPDAAGQVVGSPNRFTSISGASHMLFLTQGYAVLDGPTMPI
jgi:dipeptidyl aminopeptidase/acylaminoacyl peptidase